MSQTAGAVLVFAADGPQLTADERLFFQEAKPAGVTLFKRNILDPYSDATRLTSEIQDLIGKDLTAIIAIDQEGGRVSRIGGGFPNLGPALGLARGEFDAEAISEIRTYASNVGAALLSVGVNVNFAPVVDILTEPSNTAIGDRVFGTDVEPVCQRAGAFLDGMADVGVAGCLKHFPGQGDAKVDTHFGRALVDLPTKLLYDRELVPYRALAGRAPMIMISHCVYPGFDSVEASRSPRIIGGLLRGEMEYRGVIVSDDMTMGALPQDEKAWQEAIVESLAAGVDMVLVCKGLDRCRLAYEAVRRAEQRSKVLRTRIAEAADAVSELRRQLRTRSKEH